jgi:hypothetical protein
MVVICFYVACFDIVVLCKALKTSKLLSFAHMSHEEVSESLLKSKLSSYHCIDAYVKDVIFFYYIGRNMKEYFQMLGF